MAAQAVATRQVAGPNPLRRGRLSELAERLERLKATTKDVVADTRNVQVQPYPGGVQLDVPGVGPLPLSRYAHTQLAEKTGIPQRYYDRMAQEDPALLATNIGTWFTREPDRRLFRAADGHVRGILSDRYRSIDNYDVAALIAERAEQMGAQVQECSLSETRMHIKLTVPSQREVLGKLTEAQVNAARARGLFGPTGRDTHLTRPEIDADYVVPSLTVSNSEVGASAFRVEPGVFRLICWNMAVSEQSLYQVHIGKRLEVGEIRYSEDTIRHEDLALAGKVRDTIDAVFTKGSFRAMVERMTTAKEVQVEKPLDVTDAVAVKLGISETRKQELLRHFSVEGFTAFGLGQAVSRLAQDVEDADEQVQLERVAGEIIAKPDAWVVAEA